MPAKAYLSRAGPIGYIAPTGLPGSDRYDLPHFNPTEPRPADAVDCRHGNYRGRTGTSAAAGPAARTATTTEYVARAKRPAAAAAGFDHPARHRHAGRQARLHGDRRHPVAVRP